MSEQSPGQPPGSAPSTRWLIHHRSSVALASAGVLALVMMVWGASELFAPFPKRTTGASCDPAHQIVVRTLGRSEVTVSVYNAGAKAGTAARFAAQFTKLGFKVSTVTNAPTGTQVPVSEVVGPSTTDPATMLVAATLGQSATVTSDPALLIGPGVNVFIGPRHHAMVKHPPHTVPLSTPQVLCG